MYDDFDVYADVATSEEEKPDWAKIINDMIVKDGKHLGDWNVGVIGLDKTDEKTMRFVSFMAKMSDQNLEKCEVPEANWFDKPEVEQPKEDDSGFEIGGEVINGEDDDMNEWDMNGDNGDMFDFDMNGEDDDERVDNTKVFGQEFDFDTKWGQ